MWARKQIAGFDVGKWQSSISEHGLWPTSLKNLSELASGEGFNEYFQKQFNGNEAAYLRWKEVFDVLEFGNARDVGPDLSLEQQVLKFTRSEDLVTLRALSKMCSPDFFDDPSLLVVAWRRILEVLVLTLPPVVVEKKVRGKKMQKKKKKANSRKMEIFDASFALGKACNKVRDFEDARRYLKRAKEGYEEQLGRDSQKALELTYCLIMVTGTMSDRSERLRDLVKRCEKTLGEENVVTLQTLNALGGALDKNKEYEEAIEVYERCLAGRMKVFGEDHKDTLGSLNNLGTIYVDLKNYEKALECLERALKEKETTLRKNHPTTVASVMNIAIVYKIQKHYGKAEELYQRALKGKEAQLGKDHIDTMRCAENYRNCLKASGNSAGLAELRKAHPNVDNYDV